MRPKGILWILLLCLLIFSCDKILEENISKKRPEMKAPANGATLVNNSVTFWWTEIEGADAYRLQVVSPSFDSTLYLIYDSLVYGDRMMLSLTPQTYQWRVIAENSAYMSRFDTYTLTIDSTSDLSMLSVIQLAPLDSTYLSRASVSFTWEELTSAEDFRFQLFDAANTMLLDEIITDNSIVVDQLLEGAYRWRVRGQNSSSNTPYAERIVTIDQTAPLAPALTFPQDSAVFTSDSVTLKWQSTIESDIDSVFVYNDILGSFLVKSFQVTTDSVIFTSSSPGTFYWNAKSLDKAGNGSSFSDTRMFELVP